MNVLKTANQMNQLTLGPSGPPIGLFQGSMSVEKLADLHLPPRDILEKIGNACHAHQNLRFMETCSPGQRKNAGFALHANQETLWDSHLDIIWAAGTQQTNSISIKMIQNEHLLLWIQRYLLRKYGWCDDHDDWGLVKYWGSTGFLKERTKRDDKNKRNKFFQATNIFLPAWKRYVPGFNATSSGSTRTLKREKVEVLDPCPTWNLGIQIINIYTCHISIL